LIEICNQNTRHVTARCLEPHDLAVSKLVAGRDKDREFLLEMFRHSMIDGELLLERIGNLPVSMEEQNAVRERWQRIRQSAGSEIE